MMTRFTAEERKELRSAAPRCMVAALVFAVFFGTLWLWPFVRDPMLRWWLLYASGTGAVLLFVLYLLMKKPSRAEKLEQVAMEPLEKAEFPERWVP